MSRKGREEREKGKKKYVERRTMIVSSDLIARDPRVSSRFNFSEKKTHSPRSFAALAFGLCDRQRESRVHDGKGGEGRGGERERALVLGFDSRRGDPGSLTLLIGEPSPRLVNRRALDRGSNDVAIAGHPSPTATFPFTLLLEKKKSTPTRRS